MFALHAYRKDTVYTKQFMCIPIIVFWFKGQTEIILPPTRAEQIIGRLQL